MRFIPACVLLLLLFDSAAAQQKLLLPKNWDKLALADEQKAKLKELQTKMAQELKKVKDLGTRTELQKTLLEDMHEILDEKQQIKLAAIEAKEMLFPPWTKKKLTEVQLANLHPILKQHLPVFLSLQAQQRQAAARKDVGQFRNLENMIGEQSRTLNAEMEEAIANKDVTLPFLPKNWSRLELTDEQRQMLKQSHAQKTKELRKEPDQKAKDKTERAWKNDILKMLNDKQKTKLAALDAKDMLVPPWTERKLADEQLARLLPILKHHVPLIAEIKNAQKAADEEQLRLLEQSQKVKSATDRRFFDNLRDLLGQKQDDLGIALDETNKKLEVLIDDAIAKESVKDVQFPKRTDKEKAVRLENSNKAKDKYDAYVSNPPARLRWDFYVSNANDICFRIGQAYLKGELTKEKAQRDVPYLDAIVPAYERPECLREARYLATEIRRDLLISKEHDVTLGEAWETFEKLGLELPKGKAGGTRKFEFRITQPGKADFLDVAEARNVVDARETLKGRYPSATRIRCLREVQ